MSFIVYDIVLLVLFVIAVSIFLYSKRKNLKREGLLFLYRTSWGIKLINYVGNKYKKTLSVLSYVSIGIGYILMIAMLYLFGKLIWVYVAFPQIVQQIKVPPIMPLIPYLPQMFKIEGLPPFYFTYWIIIIAIIAITHEFAHGIFAVRNKVKIKTTGFGFFPFFLPIFLAAFVELDEKKMVKKKNFSQRAILSAGTFANVITAIFFFVILWIFFSLAFTPAGVVFDSYAASLVPISNISSVNGITLDNPYYEKILELSNDEELNKIEANEKTYLAPMKLLEQQKNNEGEIILYDDAPAIRAGLVGAITHINGVKINKLEDISTELVKYSPGDKIIISATTGEKTKDYEIVLEENPNNKNKPWIGIGFAYQERSGVVGKIIDALSSFKKSNIYYEPKFGEWNSLVYNLLWWIILISISVALVNMLPLGLFDGARFFYLTALLITKNEKNAKKILSAISYLLLFLVVVIMFFWAYSFIR